MAESDSNNIETLAQIASETQEGKKESQAQSPHAGSDASLPEKDELIQMSKSDLDTLIEGVVQKHNSEISEMKSHVERLEGELKKREQVSYLQRRGQESLRSKGVEVHQSRPLNPIDHQSQLVKENADKLKGKQPRFVTNNESLRSLRRAQGYEPVRDEDGNEVRYMDGVLMGIPERRYKEEIESDREYRKSLRRQQLKSNLEQRGAESGVETFGDIDFDDSPVYDGG